MPSPIKRVAGGAAIVALLGLLSLTGNSSLADAEREQACNCDMVIHGHWPAEMCPLPRSEPSTRIAAR